MRRVVAWLIGFVALWWLWLLLAGEWNHTEWIAAAAAAAVAITLGEVARGRAGVSPGLPLHVVRSLPSALAMVFVDFAVVLWALATRAQGTFRETKTSVAANEQTRAWATYLATISPNAYVLDVDPERNVALTHHLVPLQRSQEPV